MQVPEQRKLYHDGTIHVRCSNGCAAKVTFKDKKNREFSGELFNKSKESIGNVSGNWNRAIYVKQNGGERELMAQTDSPAKDYYGFSPFTMGLNELHDDESAHLPPTDSRFRPDMRELENGNVEQATANKSALEKAQKSRKSPASVLWFREHEDEYTRKKVYRSNGRYWNAKQNGFKSQKNGKLFTNIFEI